MTLDQARNKLRRMVQASREPQLQDPDLDAILEDARRPDSAGVLVGAAGYVDTWDLSWAAVEGWETKASRASDLISANVGGGTIPADQIFEHCKRQADIYRRRLNRSVSFFG